MLNQTVDFQAKMYVYDLNNCAKEFGFKADEGWEISLVNDLDRIDLERKYYPTITTKVLPEILTELFRSVKTKLIQPKSGFEKNYESAGTADRDMQFLVAFNPKRARP